MSLTIILDSGPLGLIVHQRAAAIVVECRAWLQRRLTSADRILVPAIDGRFSCSMLSFPLSQAPLTDAHLQQAARLWADLRQQDAVTADPHALDIDVILAAQVLSLGLKKDEFVVATTNLSHFERLVPAKLWQQIG